MNKILKIDPTLRKVLNDQSDQQFTVTELRDLFAHSYQRTTGREIDPAEVRKWLYRRIYKMTETGYFEKIYDEKGGFTGYKLAEKYKSAKLKDAKTCHFDSINEAIEKVSIKNDCVQGILKSLRDKAKQYQVDLDANISETEEYKRLYESYPSLKLQLEALYELTKNKSSKLLGQLTATQNIISQLEEDPS